MKIRSLAALPFLPTPALEAVLLRTPPRDAVVQPAGAPAALALAPTTTPTYYDYAYYYCYYY